MRRNRLRRFRPTNFNPLTESQVPPPNQRRAEPAKLYPPYNRLLPNMTCQRAPADSVGYESMSWLSPAALIMLRWIRPGMSEFLAAAIIRNAHALRGSCLGRSAGFPGYLTKKEIAMGRNPLLALALLILVPAAQAEGPRQKPTLHRTLLQFSSAYGGDELP